MGAPNQPDFRTANDLFGNCGFRMILTFTSKITTISGRKIEILRISFLSLVSRRAYSRRLSRFGAKV